MSQEHAKERPELWLIRHGETEWSLSGKHTGRTDIALTPRGRQRALHIRERLQNADFALVLTSPLQRAQETCRLAGLAEHAQLEPNLLEWDYGVYEGRTTAEIRQERPGWSVWNSDIPQGESLDQVGRRAQAVIDRALQAGGKVALVSHAHMLRILTAVWLGSSPDYGRHFSLSTGSLSKLGLEREERVIQLWNRPLEDE